MNKNNDLARGAPSARADTTRYTAVAKGLHWLLAIPWSISLLQQRRLPPYCYARFFNRLVCLRAA